MNASFNDQITFYPNFRGWEAMREILKKRNTDQLRPLNIEEELKAHTTEDGGYKDQLWQIMQTFGQLFYNGSNYLTTTTIKIQTNNPC